MESIDGVGLLFHFLEKSRRRGKKEEEDLPRFEEPPSGRLRRLFISLIAGATAVGGSSSSLPPVLSLFSRCFQKKRQGKRQEEGEEERVLPLSGKGGGRKGARYQEKEVNRSMSQYRTLTESS